MTASGPTYSHCEANFEENSIPLKSNGYSKGNNSVEGMCTVSPWAQPISIVNSTKFL